MNNIIKYRPDIDALRAISVIFVVMFHLNEQMIVSGFIGVDIFFVISGYLITKIILKKCEQGNFSFINFYARRTKRIFPALFVVLFFSSIFAVLSLPHDLYENFFRSLRYASMQLANFLFARKVGYFDDTGNVQPLLHTWSLGVEEQFYIIWPLILFTLIQVKNFSRKAVFIALTILLALSWWGNIYMQGFNSQKAFYMFYTRSWEFCFGALVALEVIPSIKNRIINELVSFAALISIFAIAFYSSTSHYYMLIVTSLSSIAASIYIYSGQSRVTLVNRILSVRPIVFIGLISYSLYLWHWPIIVFFKQIFEAELSLYDEVIIFASSFILAVMTYYFVEQKTRYSNMSDKKTIIMGVVAILIFIGLSSVMKKFSESDWRLDRRDTVRDQKILDEDKAFFNLPENYKLGEENPDILVIGDSHSLHYFPIIYKRAQALNLKASVIDQDGCPPLLGDYNIVSVRANGISREGKDECKMLLARIKEALKNKSVKHVFIAMRQAVYAETTAQQGFGKSRVYLTNNKDGELTVKEARSIFSESLENTIKYIQSLNIKIHLLDQAPMLLFNPNRCSESTIMDKILYDNESIFERQKECYSVDLEYVNERLKYSRSVLSSLSEKYNLSYFSTKNVILNALSHDNKILYRDDNHLNYSGMKYLYDRMDVLN